MPLGLRVWGAARGVQEREQEREWERKWERKWEREREWEKANVWMVGMYRGSAQPWVTTIKKIQRTWFFFSSLVAVWCVLSFNHRFRLH
jgi:hypothetical protein